MTTPVMRCVSNMQAFRHAQCLRFACAKTNRSRELGNLSQRRVRSRISYVPLGKQVACCTLYMQIVLKQKLLMEWIPKRATGCDSATPINMPRGD